ncbi:DUF4352 domain-containing protein [Salibacterium salarium]|uniref:DUF4352 domain-containing protein n=1 Tax=Salibacterium salarium TaxID=284579 RepID=A0A428N4V8_9BACI|nr:DUF4352 domain-containing protein [Salibacterium salarium]RSL33277.1 DUF4352 domain-containing protein [Salibacterium salarium]
MDKKYWLLLGLMLILGLFSGMFLQSQRTTGDNEQFHQTVHANSDQLMEMGETARINKFDITIHDAYRMKQNEKQYLVVDLSFYNASDEAREIPLFNILVTDEEGYTSENESVHEDQRLVGGQIRAEGLRRGTLAFEVKQSNHYELSYTDHSGKGLGSWNLEINENKNVSEADGA